MIDFLIPSSPLVSGLLALLCLGGTWVACRSMRLADDDEGSD